MKLNKLALALVLVVALSANALADMVITEILYDPDGNDGDREWVELYNNGLAPVNMTGWKFREAGTNHGITLEQGSLIVGPGEFMVIVQELTNFSVDNPGYTGNVISSSFSLNSGEELSVLDSSLTTIDSVTYSDLASNGHSIEVIDPDLDNNNMDNWVEGELNGDPGNVMQASEEEPQNPVCGNEILEDNEECDDGNTEDGDGCSSICQIEDSEEEENNPEPVPEFGFLGIAAIISLVGLVILRRK